METHLCSRAQITSMQNDSVSHAHLHALRQFEWGWCIWTSRCALVSRCKRDWATADTTWFSLRFHLPIEPAKGRIKHWIHWKINHPYLRHNYGTILSSREERRCNEDALCCVILLILCAMKYLASVHRPKQSDVNWTRNRARILSRSSKQQDRSGFTVYFHNPNICLNIWIEY